MIDVQRLDTSESGETMSVTLVKTGARDFEARTASGHLALISASRKSGGNDIGARPMEMVLLGLGGCSGIDVLSILAKARQPVENCIITITAERANTIPAVFTRIHVAFRLSGAIDAKQATRAVTLSMEKYCSVTKMLTPHVAVSHAVELVDATN